MKLSDSNGFCGRQLTNDKGVTISQPGTGNGEQGTVNRSAKRTYLPICAYIITIKGQKVKNGSPIPVPRSRYHLKTRFLREAITVATLRFVPQG